MSTTPNTPQGPEVRETVVYETSPTPRWIPIAFGVLFVLLGYLVYAGYSARQALEARLAEADERAEVLEAKLEDSAERIAGLSGELEATTKRLGLTQEELNRARAQAQAIRREQQKSDQELLAQLAAARQEAASKIGAVASDVTEAKSDIEATRKDLEATRSKLESTIGDLGVQSGLIARNREELEELKRRGERNIFEFDIRRGRQRHRVGPVQVELKRVDTRRNRYTMDLYADDKRIEKKDKTLNEPVQFYVGGVRVPYEIVVFQIERDRVTGYLATPKELAARQ